MMDDIKISKYKLKKFNDEKIKKEESEELPLEIQKLLKIADGDY